MNPSPVVVKYFIDPLRKHPEVLWLTAILAFSTALRLSFLHLPFDRDEGQYATIAQEILLGGLPYRDAIEIKPPGSFYLYALAIGLFGATTEAVRIFTTLYAIPTVIAVYGVTRNIASTRAGLYAAVVYGIYSTFPRFVGTSNTEVFLVLPMTAGVWYLLKAITVNKRSYLYGAGLCAAFAMLIKPVALPVVVLEALLVPFFRSERRDWKDSVLDLAAFLLTAVACAMATITYFSLQGGLGDFLYWTVEFPTRYRDAQIFTTPPLTVILWHLRSELVFPALLGIPAALWSAVTKRTIPATFPLLLILAVSLAIILPGKNHPHYFIMIIPFLAIPAGIGLASITSMPKVPACLVLLVVLGTLAFSIGNNYQFYTSYSLEQIVAKTFGSTTFVESVKIARYLREQTRPDAYIFQWGFEPELYFLSGRHCPNPYLVSLLPSWSKDPLLAINKMKQSLIDKKPTHIVLQPEWSDYEGKNIVDEFIQQNCHYDTKIGYAYIFNCQ